ncbi:MAG: GyrI-like domain-containing protein [Fimbriimonas sp.]
MIKVQETRLSPIRIVTLKHAGPYENIGPVFDRLFDWIETNNVPVQRTIGIYYDNPDYVSAAQLRSAACVEVPVGYQLPNHGPEFQVQEIAGGPYATTRFVGSYEKLGPVWEELTRYVERIMVKKISDNPAFEVYVNDASETPPEQLITELYMPLA